MQTVFDRYNHTVRVRPFRSLPHLTVTAPCSVERMVRELNLGEQVSLPDNATTYAKQAAFLGILYHLVGFRVYHERAEAWCAKAQAAVDTRFA